MLVRVRVAGLPNHLDPATWPFPTAGLYGYDPVAGVAIFDVREEDVPAAVPAAGDAKRPETPAGPVLVELDEAAADAWHAKFDETYPQHAGKFRPELAK